MPGLENLIGAMFGGQSSEFSDALLGMLPQLMGNLSGEVEVPGFLQMMLGMLDAQFGNAPPEYVRQVLLMSRQLLDQLIERYTPRTAQDGQTFVAEAAVVNEDQGH